MSQTLTVTLRPSRVLALALTVAAAAAIACIWISLPLPAFLLSTAGIVLAWMWHLAPALQRGARAVRVLEVGATGGMRWQAGTGQWHESEIRPGAYVSNWLIVAALSTPGRNGPTLVLLPDCAKADDLRRLRVWLRWRCDRE